MTITRKSLDARKKSFIHYNYRVLVQVDGCEKIAEKIDSPHVKVVTHKTYTNPSFEFLRRKKT